MTYVATKNFWMHEEGNRERSKIADRCYVHSSCSTYTKRNILNYLFKELGITAGVLELEIAPLADKVTDNEDE